MHLKTTIKYHYTPARRAELKKGGKKKTLGAGRGTKQPELVFSAGRSVNWYKYFGETLLQNLLF